MPRARRTESELGAFIELAVTNAFVSAAVDRELERRGITLTYVGLLRLIDVYGPITPSELERRSALPASTLRDRVAVLMRGRYVAQMRSSTDGRSRVLEITPAGRKYLTKVMPVVRELEARIDRELGGQLAKFQDMLNRIRTYVATTGGDEAQR